MELPQRVLHTSRYTIREGIKTEPVTDRAWKVVTEAVQYAFDWLSLPGHLVVTVLNADLIRRSEGEGIGHYDSKVGHVILAAGKMEDVFGDGEPAKEDEVMAVIAESAIHECVHYWQELNDTLESTEENEEVTEGIMREIFTELIMARGDLRLTSDAYREQCLRQA